MRRLIRALFTRALWPAAVVLCITACGESVTTTTTQPAPTPTTATTPTTTPSTRGHPAVFPLTITRTGGVAGFQDVLVVAGDGLVLVTQKGQKWQCRLTPEAVERVTTAAVGVPWPDITPGATAPAFPDDLVSMVRSPAGGPVRVEDPKVSAGGRVLQDLLNDFNGGPAASRMCPPI